MMQMVDFVPNCRESCCAFMMQLMAFVQNYPKYCRIFVMQVEAFVLCYIDYCHVFLMQVMDIVLHCVDPGHLKSRGLSEVFPSICGFPQVSHCPHTRRIATGAKNGSIAMYELRAYKCQVSNSLFNKA